MVWEFSRPFPTVFSPSCRLRCAGVAVGREVPAGATGPGAGGARREQRVAGGGSQGGIQGWSLVDWDWVLRVRRFGVQEPGCGRVASRLWAVGGQWHVGAWGLGCLDGLLLI